MLSAERSELKTGKRPVQLQSRVLAPGDVLFEEGSAGRELYIVQEGLLGVYKMGSEGGEIELARIAKNGIIGEMAVLDSQPRSATIRAVEKSTCTVVSDAIFQATLQKAPAWLTSIVRIVVSRLRDTNKRVDMSVLRDRERGLIALLLLLLPESRYNFGTVPALSYELLVAESYYVCRLKKKESEALLAGFAARGIIRIEEDTEKKKHCCLPDMDICSLYYEYLLLKSQQKRFKEAAVTADAVALLSNIEYVSQKSGRKNGDEVLLSKAALFEDMADKKQDMIEKKLSDLRRKNLISLVPGDDGEDIVFEPVAIRRIKKIHEWLPRFEGEGTV